MINSKSLMVPRPYAAAVPVPTAYEVTLFPADANPDSHVSAKERARYQGMDLVPGAPASR